MAQRRAAFLVNVWFDDSAGVHVRGSVVHLPSQDRRYFTDMVDLIAFLLLCSERGRGEIADGSP
jgi:hypothetical protein